MKRHLMTKVLAASLGFPLPVMFLAPCLVLAGCGSENVFEVFDPPNNKQRGESALARGDYDEAIASLESALKANPNDPETRKMLANAYMSKSGVDTLKILQTISEKQDQTDWGVLITSMPSGDAANQQRLQRAVAVLGAIPAASRTQEERYQMAMAQTSLAVVTAKKYGVDEQGKVASDKVDQVTDADAVVIFGQLGGASENLTGVEDSGAQSAAAKIGGVVGKMNEAPGATTGDKVRSFLAAGSS